MIEFKGRTSRILSVVILLTVALEALGLVYLKELPFSRITVVNVGREADLYWPPTPGKHSEFTGADGVPQVIVGPDYGVLRQYRLALPADRGLELEAARTDLERAVILRKWARDQYDYNVGSGKIGMFDYGALLQSRIRETGPVSREAGLCDAFTTLFVAACLSQGMPARVIHLTTSGGTDSRGHYTAEVYLNDLKKWAVMDALYNCCYTIDGRPLSALELFRLRRQSLPLVSAVKVERNGSTTGPVGLPLDEYYRHFQVLARTDFDTYRLNLFTHKLVFLNWVGDGARPLGRQEAVLRVVLFYVWPGLGLAVTLVLIVGGRPRTSLLLLAARKPVRPEYRE